MNKHLRNLKLFTLSILMLITTGASAQSRDYIHEKIDEWGECRNVALTETNGDVALYGENGCAFQGCPESLEKALEELNKQNLFIDDVQLTESGNWLILYGENGVIWNGIPKDLEKQLTEYNEANESITAASFNDSGDWVVVTNIHVAASDSEIYEWLQENAKKHGELLTANLTADGIIAIYENGFSSLGNVPDELHQYLQKTDIDVYRAKFSGDSWFFSDKAGACEYHF